MISSFHLVPKPHKAKGLFKGIPIPENGKERRGGTSKAPAPAPESGGPGRPASGEENQQGQELRASPAHAPGGTQAPVELRPRGPKQGARGRLPSVHGRAAAPP